MVADYYICNRLRGDTTTFSNMPPRKRTKKGKAAQATPVRPAVQEEEQEVMVVVEEQEEVEEEEEEEEEEVGKNCAEGGGCRDCSGGCFFNLAADAVTFCR